MKIELIGQGEENILRATGQLKEMGFTASPTELTNLICARLKSMEIVEVFTMTFEAKHPETGESQTKKIVSVSRYLNDYR